MQFTHDTTYDVVEAKFARVELFSPLDVLRWRREVEGHLSRFGRKVDLLIALDGLVVHPAASTSFGRERKEVLSRFTNRSFRYQGSMTTRASVLTTAQVFGAAANIYASREEALAALLADRRAGRKP